jgi:anti-sigma28 factor (negative regulator of flagellin synthesis)
MDVVDNEFSPTHSPLQHQEAVPSHAQGAEHAAELTGAPDLLDLSVSVWCEVARKLAAACGAREARIRELQDAIERGMYQVTPEQIADKMLQDMRRH